MKRIAAICLLLCLVCALFGCAGQQEGLVGVTGGLGGNLSAGGGDKVPQTPRQESEEQQTPLPEEEKEEGSAPAPNEGDKAPAPAQEPDPEQEEPSLEETPKDYSDYITVVSYNVRQLNLGDRIDDIVALIKQMDGDIVGLQEVSEGGVTSENMVKLLARLCGYDYYYFCVSGTSSDAVGLFGSGFLSRYPFKDAETAGFTFTGGQQRRYSRAVLDVDGVDVVYYNTHLLTGNWQDTGKQFTELMRLAEGEKRPVIVTGDFNLTVGQQVELLNLKKMTPLNGGPDGLFSLDDISYDNIIISAGDFDFYEDARTVTNIKVIVSDASDRNPVYSHIKLK